MIDTNNKLYAEISFGVTAEDLAGSLQTGEFGT